MESKLYRIAWHATPLRALICAAAAVVWAHAGAPAGAATLHGPRGIVPARTPARQLTQLPRLLAPQSKSASSPPAIAQLVYQGGPVMRTNRVYTIFWQPSTLPTGVSAFPSGPPSYEKVVEEYFSRVAHASEPTSGEAFGDAYSVGGEYYEAEGPSAAKRYIENRTSFPLPSDTAVDSSPFPTGECTDKTFTGVTLNVCLTDEQLQHEIEAVVKAHSWSAGPNSIFFLYTPEGVGSCFAKGSESSTNKCAYSYYCAYHNAFISTSSSEEVIYANIPYAAVEGCDNRARPEGSTAGPAIDDSSHEHNESITDPTGRGWWDNWGSEESNAVFGFEIADLCVFETFEATYGPLAAGSPTYGQPGAFNQTIDGGHYLLQQEWSNSATESGGGCEQRLVPAAFAMTPSSGAAATEPVAFNGSASGGGGATVVEWHWNFGDGQQAASSTSSTVMHTYASSGVYEVTLTVKDLSGDTNTISHNIAIGPASQTTTTTVTTPAPPPPTETTTVTTPAPAPLPSSTTTIVREPVTPPAYTAAQVAGLIGLPPNGATRPALNGLAVGSAHCPPACTITLKLSASVSQTKHRKRTVRRLAIGTLTRILGANSTDVLTLTLNATGRRLLAKSHRLSSQLTVTVVGQEGGSWQIVRTLKLTSSGHATRRR